MRVGMGYDVHKLVENRKLILGGVEIPYEYGLLGHSDADVLTHAVMDALTGAVYKLDIGDTVEAVVYRSGKQYRVSLTVMEDKG